MCGRGGKSVDAYYQEIKPTPMALPSLSMSTKAIKKPKYGTPRTGSERRNLLQPFSGQSNG